MTLSKTTVLQETRLVRDQNTNLSALVSEIIVVPTQSGSTSDYNGKGRVRVFIMYFTTQFFRILVRTGRRGRTGRNETWKLPKIQFSFLVRILQVFPKTLVRFYYIRLVTVNMHFYRHAGLGGLGCLNTVKTEAGFRNV